MIIRKIYSKLEQYQDIFTNHFLMFQSLLIAHLVNYFATSKVCNASLRINQSAIDLFHNGHLRQVETAESNGMLWIRANLSSSIRKDTIME